MAWHLSNQPASSPRHATRACHANQKTFFWKKESGPKKTNASGPKGRWETLQQK
jgi:hypothetical protein